jgi:integrase
VVQITKPTLDEARATLDALLDRRAVTHAATSRPGTTTMTLAGLCTDWLSRKTDLAPATRESYEIHLRVHIVPGIGSLDANLIRPLELEDFYGGLTYATAQKCHMVLRGAFDWAIRNERLSRPSNPTYAVRPNRRMCADHDGYFGEDDDFRTVPEKAIPKLEEIKLLIKDAKARGQRWWWLYLVIAVTTGARPGEICALRRRDFDLSEHTIRIEWSADKVSKRLKRPKTPWSVRTVRLAPKFFDRIAPHLPKDPDAFLLPSAEACGRRGGSVLECMNSRSIERKLDRQLGRLGLPHYTPHGFRHYVATHMLDAGKQALQVGKFLGHRDDQMVRKLYGAHIVDDTQRSIGEAASRLVLELDDDGWE